MEIGGLGSEVSEFQAMENQVQNNMGTKWKLGFMRIGFMGSDEV